MNGEEAPDLPEKALADWLASLVASLSSPTSEEVGVALAMADRDLKMMVGTLPSVMAPVWRALKDVLDRRDTLGDALAGRARKLLLAKLWSAHYFIKDRSELGDLIEWYHQQPEARPFE